MQKERNDLKAGIFILISLALIVVVIISIKGIGRLIEPEQHRSVTFALTDDIGGLRKGDDVRIGGFKVGVIRDIEVVDREADGPHIVIRFAIPAKFSVRADARLSVQGTLTGMSWLNFDSLGSPEEAMLAQDERLVGRPSVMSSILAGASGLAPELSGAVRDVRSVTLPKVNETIDTYHATGRHVTALVKDVRSRLDPIVERYYAVMDTGRDAAGHIRDIFGETKGDIKGTMANVNAATGTVREKLPPILDKLDSGLAKAQTTIDSANAALEDIKQIAANTKDATGTARSLLVGNRSRIDGMIASLKTTADNLKFASAEIRRSPWRLLYKPGPGEVANLNLYDSTRQFAEGAGSLNDAAAALRDALADPSATPQQLEALIERLDKSFENFVAIEQELWKQVR